MEFDVVSEGLQFPEGPVPLLDGSVIIVEIACQRVTRISPDGSKDVVCQTGGGPNGAAVGPDGALYICNNGGMRFSRTRDGLVYSEGAADDWSGGSIQRLLLESGHMSTLYSHCEGARLRSPNDIVFDRSGGFWFTDMGRADGERIERGAIYYARTDGSSIRKVPIPVLTPNGIGLSPDGKILWIAETLTSRLLGIELAGPGEPTRQTSWFEPPSVLGPLPGLQMFDSLAVEARGRICVATPLTGAISIFDQRGLIEQIAIPDPIPTNIAFGGPDFRTAWVTCGGTGRLLKARWPRPGLPPSFQAGVA